jgi:hypothetical protein
MALYSNLLADEKRENHPDQRYDRVDRPPNDRDGRPPRELRPPRQPKQFPSRPPYTAYLGNLSCDVQERDVGYFFEDAGCQVEMSSNSSLQFVQILHGFFIPWHGSIGSESRFINVISGQFHSNLVIG